MKPQRYILLLLLLLLIGEMQAQSASEQKKLWKQVRKEIPEFKKVFKKYKKYRFEIVYTRVEHDPVQGNKYQRYYFGDHNQYFYPASTVKFPMALKTFQKMNHLFEQSAFSTSNIDFLPLDSTWCGNVNKSIFLHRYLRITDSLSTQHAAAMGGIRREEFCQINRLDPLKKIAPGKTVRITPYTEPLTMNEMMSEMLIYSNNHYFNWLFEFAVNENPPLTKPGIDIHKRLMVCNHPDSSATRALNMRIGREPPYVFIPGEKIKYNPQPLFSSGYTVGKKYFDFNDNLIQHGRNFSNHNQIKLESLQDQLIELIYPGFLPEGAAYEITQDQRRQLIQWMGMRPLEDKIVSDSNYLKATDDFTNFLYTGQKHDKMPQNFRIVNVIGQAYGFVTDCAYMADEDKKVEFFLAARIYVNKDEVLNDDKYEYEEIAYPLMEKLGKIILQYEQAHPQGSGALPAVFQIFR